MSRASPMARTEPEPRAVPSPRPAWRPEPVEYPSEGVRVPQSDEHDHCGHYSSGALRVRYRHRPDVYVAHDKQAKPRKSVATDVLVAFGVEDKPRGSYKLWEESKAPDFVLEILSPSTFRNDLGRKRRRYRKLGVREYWIHGPSGELPVPRLAQAEARNAELEARLRAMPVRRVPPRRG